MYFQYKMEALASLQGKCEFTTLCLMFSEQEFKENKFTIIEK